MLLGFSGLSSGCLLLGTELSLGLRSSFCFGTINLDFPEVLDVLITYFKELLRVLYVLVNGRLKEIIAISEFMINLT